MGLSGAGIAGVVGVRWLGGTAVAAVDSAQDPDFVVFNAKVYTVDPLTPRAEAFAIKPAGSSPWGAPKTSRHSSASGPRHSMPSR
jgi:hypothetical protein